MPSRSSCLRRQKRGERRYHVPDVSTIPLSSTPCSPSWKAASRHFKRGNGDTRSTLTLPSAVESSFRFPRVSDQQTSTTRAVLKRLDRDVNAARNILARVWPGTGQWSITL